jgi:hypothetical protein
MKAKRKKTEKRRKRKKRGGKDRCADIDTQLTRLGIQFEHTSDQIVKVNTNRHAGRRAKQDTRKCAVTASPNESIRKRSHCKQQQ